MAEPTAPEPRTPDELGFETIVYEKAPPRAISRSIRKSNAFSTSGRFSRMVARGGSFS